LDRPTVLDEPISEKVEQLGVGWHFPKTAEIIGRGDQAGAKDPVPDAIDEDARGKRIAWTCDQLGQLAAAAAGTVKAAARRRQHFDVTARHRRTEVFVDAAHVEAIVVARL